MANNQAQDRYNPPSTTHQDYEKFSFGELEVNELFWLNESTTVGNVVHRKIDQTQAMQLKSRKLVSFDSRLKVYQKN